MNPESKENILLVIERVKRGRPSKAKPVIDLDQEINKRGRGRPKKEILIKERIPVGRPKKLDIIDKMEYNKNYYQQNKDRVKIVGDFECPYCCKLSSLANKLRHFKKYHPEII